MRNPVVGGEGVLGVSVLIPSLLHQPSVVFVFDHERPIKTDNTAYFYQSELLFLAIFRSKTPTARLIHHGFGFTFY
jgi:hypothetical protein